MKTTIIISLLSFFIFCNTSCKKTPIACFSPSTVTVAPGEIVHFQSCSFEKKPGKSVAKSTSYSWDFADGTNGSGETCDHSFANTGVYLVTLTIKEKSETSKSCNQITVENPNQRFIGTYTATDVCSGGSGAYTLTIRAGSSNSSVIIDNLAGAFNGIIGTVQGDFLTIPIQNDVYTTGGDENDIDGGSGTITGSKLTFTYSFDDINYLDAAGYISCNSTAVK